MQIPVRAASIAVALILTALPFDTAVADGIVVSKIYDPYVQPLETEIEWRFVTQDTDRVPDAQRHSIGVGRSLTDRWGVEFYAIANKGSGESLSVDAYELEAKWQLTEQGEYAVDWGLLFELEREINANAWEAAATLLASRDFGRTTVTANLGLIYEGGERIENEFESILRMQMRYRMKETFEPSVEVHVGQDTTAIGPTISGLMRVSSGRKLRWDVGLFAGITERSPDHILKANIEFEF
jgi:hypothetical protein